MSKKTVKNRYGVQVGDIFNRKSNHEDGSMYSFYQVIALRGETQVAVREIRSKVIAFDGVYEGVVPVLDSWISDEILVRKVHSDSTYNTGSNIFEDGICSVSINICGSYFGGYAYLDREEMYLEWDNGPGFAYLFEKYNPKLAKQLDLRSGSGVYAMDRAFRSYSDDCRAMIRYPDGKEDTVILKELLHYDEEEQQQWELNNSLETAKKREDITEGSTNR